MMGDLVGTIVGFALVAGVPGYLVLQPWALRRLRGAWRIAAAVPLIGAAATICWSLYALSQDSNLWPLTFILFAPPAAFYLLIVAGLRRLVAAGAD
jgi:hypothetical protein